MSEENQPSSKRRTEPLTATDLTRDPKPQSTWHSTDKMEKGGTTAPDTSQPRDRRDHGERVVTGFTRTSPTGSMGGRATFGMDPASGRESEDKEEEAG